MNNMWVLFVENFAFGVYEDEQVARQVSKEVQERRRVQAAVYRLPVNQTADEVVDAIDTVRLFNQQD